MAELLRTYDNMGFHATRTDCDKEGHDLTLEIEGSLNVVTDTNGDPLEDVDGNLIYDAESDAHIVAIGDIPIYAKMAERAIATESGVNIDEALARIPSTIDTELDPNSHNPVENRAIYEAFKNSVNISQLAPEYDPGCDPQYGKTAECTHFCTHDGKLYKCTEDIVAAGSPWNPAFWVQIDVYELVEFEFRTEFPTLVRDNEAEEQQIDDIVDSLDL